MMNNVTNAFTDKANLIGGAFISALTSVFGVYWQIFAFFFVLNISDFICGGMKAKRTNTWSSKRGAEGIFKKVSYWFIVAVAFAISNILIEMGSIIGLNLSFLALIGWFTLATLIINELTSILENLVLLGVDVPPILTRGLAVVKTAVDEAGNKIIPDIKEDRKE